jgi:hypothetical protein
VTQPVSGNVTSTVLALTHSLSVARAIQATEQAVRLGFVVTMQHS